MTETNKARLIATGVIMLALVAAAPVFADSNEGRGENGLRLGGIIKLWNEERRDERREQREVKKHASSTKATSTHQFSVEGKVTAVGGTILTVQGKHGASYSVQASGATITGHNGALLTIGALAVNDKVKVNGTLSGNVIVATKIKDKSDTTGKLFRAISIGTVTAVSGSTITFDTFGASGSATAVTNTSTKYSVNGAATTSAALKVGSRVIIAGSSTLATGGTINASIVYIFTEGISWLRHILR